MPKENGAMTGQEVRDWHQMHMAHKAKNEAYAVPISDWAMCEFNHRPRGSGLGPVVTSNTDPLCTDFAAIRLVLGGYSVALCRRHGEEVIDVVGHALEESPIPMDAGVKVIRMEGG